MCTKYGVMIESKECDINAMFAVAMLLYSVTSFYMDEYVPHSRTLLNIRAGL